MLRISEIAASDIHRAYPPAVPGDLFEVHIDDNAESCCAFRTDAANLRAWLPDYPDSQIKRFAEGCMQRAGVALCVVHESGAYLVEVQP